MMVEFVIGTLIAPLKRLEAFEVAPVVNNKKAICILDIALQTSLYISFGHAEKLGPAPVYAVGVLKLRKAIRFILNNPQYLDHKITSSFVYRFVLFVISTPCRIIAIIPSIALWDDHNAS